MVYVRIYTGADGQSRFEDLDIPFEPSDHATVGLFESQATNALFRREPPGLIQDWHTAPRRQYVITLSGSSEIEAGSGEKRQFGPGDVLLADDLTGKGHITRITSSVIRVSVAIPIAD